VAEGGLFQLRERSGVVGYPLRFNTLRQPEGALQAVDKHPLRRRLFIQLRLPVDKYPPVIAVAHQAGDRSGSAPARFAAAPWATAHGRFPCRRCFAGSYKYVDKK
jgi:hypothetical protein